MTIYKILPKRLWEEALQTGAFAGSPVDIADGFIHFSTASQVQETAAKHFSGVRDLVLVAVDANALGDAIKWEPSRGGALFPHLYGSLPVKLAEWVKLMALDANGTPRVPE
jgi:uncharacterized protein (DUF952 family)